MGSRGLRVAWGPQPACVDACPPRRGGLGRVPAPVPSGPSWPFFPLSFYSLCAPSSLRGLHPHRARQAPHLFLSAFSTPDPGGGRWAGASGRVGLEPARRLGPERPERERPRSTQLSCVLWGQHPLRPPAPARPARGPQRSHTRTDTQCQGGRPPGCPGEGGELLAYHVPLAPS